MSAIRELEERMKEARIHGCLYHPTNPSDAYYCKGCGVLGRGGTVCWACDSPDVLWQVVPRFGGGAQAVIMDPEQNLTTYP